MSGFKTMVNESSASCDTWTRITGQACPGMSEKTFGVVSAVHRVVGRVDKIPAFLCEAQSRGLAKKSVAKMAEAWNVKTLRAELLFCKSFGKLLHDASFELEGDGFCNAYVNRHVVLISKLQQEVKRDRQAFRMITDSVEASLQDGMPAAGVDAFVKRVHAAADAVMLHFDRAVLSAMKQALPLYQAASLFDPQRFAVEWSKPDFAAGDLCIWTCSGD